MTTDQIVSLIECSSYVRVYQDHAVFVLAVAGEWTNGEDRVYENKDAAAALDAAFADFERITRGDFLSME